MQILLQTCEASVGHVDAVKIAEWMLVYVKSTVQVD
jgi:hypothetical protein